MIANVPLLEGMGWVGMRAVSVRVRGSEGGREEGRKQRGSDGMRERDWSTGLAEKGTISEELLDKGSFPVSG